MAQQFESYKKVKELGAGSFGKAFLVEWSSDGSLAVIKQIDINAIKSKKERDSIEKEGKILEQLNHINIIGFREVYKTKKGKIWIVMEYADGGDLSDKVKSMKNKGEYFTEDQILDYFTQMCLAIKHIHDRKIIHRDLKAQNIFLEKNGTIKLGDFGIAKVLEQTVAQANTQVGTPYYISPEIIKGKAYSFATDVWSLGIILYEMWALDVPIKAKNLHELYMKISSCKGVKPLPRRYSQGMQDLIDEMLVADPDKRPTVNKILKRDILKGRVMSYLNASDFEEEFSHTILHNEYLFDMRKKRAKPISNPNAQAPPLPQPSGSDNKQKVFLVNQVAPSPKPRNWVNESPRAAKGGFVGHRPLSSNKKESASKPNYRPYSAKLGANQNKVPSVKKNASKKALVIQGEEIKPVVVKNDGRRKVSDMFEENKISKDYDKYDQKIKERAQQINDKVNKIYSLAKNEEEKVLNDHNFKPANFVDKPLAKQLGWMKPTDENMENSKENTHFREDNKDEEIKAKAKQKIDKYRRSILKMLDSDNDEEQLGDGLETNREVSEEDDREDDNILEGTGKSIKVNVHEREKDLTLDIDSEPELVTIHGAPYFKKSDHLYVEPLYTILKAVIIDQFGVENTEKGIEFVKSKGSDIYIETNKTNLITEFRENCFNESNESILEFISTVSSLVSYN